MATDLIAPLGAFVMLTVMVSLLTRLIATGMLNKTLREAIKGAPASVPVLAAKLDARQPWGDALLGWLLISFTVGLVLLALFEDAESRRQMLQAAIVPLVMGVTALAYARFAIRGETKA